MTITIIQRHYDLIVKHALESYPYEGGGFIGGRDDVILGIFPVPNFEKWYHKDKIAFMWDEITKTQVETVCYRFNLQMIGLYHSHPNGIALPSTQDFLAHKEYNLKICLIAGIEVIQNKLNVKINAFSFPDPSEENFLKRQFNRETLQIIDDYELEEFLKQRELKKEIEMETQKYLYEQERLKRAAESIMEKYSNDEK